MLEQLVYTRGKPRIDLNAGARQIPSDGFGVSNISEGLLPLLSSEEQRRFVLERAALKNGSNEVSIGLFDSYEYNRLSDGTYMLSYEYSRPFSPDLSVPGSSRLSGIFVKQCLVGALQGYPYQWIGSDVWTAWRVPDADYRRDTLPPRLPSVPGTPSGGSIRDEDIDAFLTGPRRNCAADALCFLLRQFALPEEERQVLVIRDTPEHVALWVSALQRVLPAGMAREITFATNRTKLNIQPEPVLFSYSTRTGPDGRTIRIRRPYCMIVGCHPKDPTCSGLSAGSGSRYALLSGADCTLSPRIEMTPEERSFLTAAMDRSPEARTFFDRPYGRLSMDAAARALPRLFSAETWLQSGRDSSGEKTDYDSVLAHLQDLSEFGITGNESLRKETASGALEALAENLEEDERRNWPLAQQCASLLQSVGRGGEFVSLLLSYLTRNLFSSADASRIVALERAAAGGELPSCMDPVQDALFSGDYMPLLSNLIRQDRLDSESVAALARLFLSRLAFHRVDDSMIISSEVCMTFFSRALASLSDAPHALREVLSILSRRPALLEALAVRVTGELGQKDERSRTTWLQTIFTIPGYDPLSLYQKLRSANEIEPAALESLLVMMLNQPDSDPRRVMDSFRALAGSGVAVDGTEFYRSAMRRLPRSQLGDLIDDIRSLRLPLRSQQSLLLEMDALVDYPASLREEDPAIRLLREWGRSLSPCVSTVAELSEFCHVFCRSGNERDALDIIRRWSSLAPHLLPDERYYRQSECFPRLVRRAGDFRSPEVHAALLSMFGSAPIDLGSYYDAYIALLVPAEQGLAEGISFLLKGRNRTDPGLEQAALLLRAAREQNRRNGSSARRQTDLIRQCVYRALMRRGERRLRRDLSAMESSDPDAALDLRRLTDIWERERR